MRKWNGILAAVILVLFLVHGILGAFQLLGAGNVISKGISHLMTTLILVHAVIGVYLTAQTIQAGKKAGVSYFHENRLFWARRISGFLIMALLFFHMTAFGDNSYSAYRLQPFGRAKLITQLLLVLTVAVHVISNAKPALITFGIRKLRPKAADILFLMTVLLVFMAISFIVYYLRWNTL